MSRENRRASARFGGATVEPSDSCRCSQADFGNDLLRGVHRPSRSETRLDNLMCASSEEIRRSKRARSGSDSDTASTPLLSSRARRSGLLRSWLCAFP
jgi:hypothetical protein